MVPQAADIAFLDATSGLDRTDCKVFRVLCPSPAGGLPQGLIITSSERDEVLTEALTIFRDQCAPSYAFKGRGADGPRVWMSDDCQAEIKSIKAVFPLSTPLLCQWHLIAAVWRWLWDRHHEIEHEDRPHLLKLFQKLLYAKTSQEYEIARLELFEDETADNYKNYIEHLSSSYFGRVEAWTTFSRLESNLSTHHHMTNNMVEASFHVLKNYTFNRQMEFNVASLLAKLLAEDSKYYENKLIDIGNSVFSSHVSKSRYNKKVSIPKEDVIEVCPQSKIYMVKSQNKEEDNLFYRQNMKTGHCSCPDGRDFGPCKHKALTECNYHS